MRRGECYRCLQPVRQLGQATVELALTLPVVVMFALISAQVGLVAVDLVLIHHAAREGARAASVDPSLGAATSGAQGSTSLSADRMAVRLSGGTVRGDQATVTVRYRSPTEVPLVGQLIGDITVSATVTMRVE